MGDVSDGPAYDRRYLLGRVAVGAGNALGQARIVQRIGHGGLLLLHLHDQRYQQHNYDSPVLGIGHFVHVPIACQWYVACQIGVLVPNRDCDWVGNAV